MFVNQLDVSGKLRLNQILHTLKHVHDFEFSNMDVPSLNETQAQYEKLKSQIVENSGFNSYYNDPTYTKAALITEAVRMLLEIAPKRKKKKTVESTESFEETPMISEKKATKDWDGDGKIESEKDEVWGSRLRAADKKKKSKLKEDQNLQQAETLLAAKDISDKLQDMAEDAAKMTVDSLMPLVDTMKEQFGQDQANAFNEVVKQNLQTVLDSIIKAKDETDNAILAIQGGQTPSAATDISQPLPGAEPGMEPGMDTGAETPEPDFSATGASSGPVEEPLGRASKRDLSEAGKTCMECGVGVYESQKGQMMCNECGSTWVSEAWDTKMKTAKKDIGKWEGWTISELKARKKKLMDKEERSEKEQKEVRQINFALRAKQKDHWGKIKEAEESSVGQLATMALTGKDGKGKPLTSQQKMAAKKAADELAKAKIEEKLTKSMTSAEIISDFVHSKDPKFKGKSKAERTKMALGAYYGMHPEKSKKEESQIAKANQLLEALGTHLTQLQEAFNTHKNTFAAQLSEGTQIDPLGLGYGLEGDALKVKIREVKSKIRETQLVKSKIQNHIQEQKNQSESAKREIQQLSEKLGSNPYGVAGIDQNGRKTSRFFESAEARTMWLEFHKDTLRETQLIDPSNIEKARQYLSKKIR